VDAPVGADAMFGRGFYGGAMPPRIKSGTGFAGRRSIANINDQQWICNESSAEGPSGRAASSDTRQQKTRRRFRRRAYFAVSHFAI
jgi:hypothetical protein